MRLMLHFFRAYPRHTLIMLLAQLLAGVMEGVSLTALLPMLNIAVSGGKGEFGSGVGKAVTAALRFIGITPTVASLLAVACSSAATVARIF